MRTLEKNKTKLWYSYPIGEVDGLDDEGYYTGEKEIQYSIPTPIKLGLTPTSGRVLERTFGISANIHFITTTTLELKPNGLLFYEFPTGDYINNYDLKIRKVLSSLNHNQYGLKGRE